MSPILTGILASQITGHLSTNSFESIATVTVGSGGSSSISFSSIPSTYKHLQIRMSARSTDTGTGANTNVIFNGSGTGYSTHYVQGDGSTTGAGAIVNGSYIIPAQITGNGATSGIFSPNIIDILDYADTNKYKTLRSLGGNELNGSGNIVLWSGNWRQTTAISSITFTISGASNFTQYSSFALYGIK